MALRNLLIRIPLYAVLIAFTVVALVPFVWLVAAALKPEPDLFTYLFFGPRVTLDNFRDLFVKEPFLRYVLNSIFITCTGVTLQVFFSSLAGFALAKYQFVGRKVIYSIMLATLMIPGQVTMAPTYELLYKMHLVDTFPGLLIPGAVSVFGIFLFDRALRQIPDELIQAARIDGCTEFRIYWEIVMPVARPTIGAFCLVSFMGSWNSFLWPTILLHAKERFTLPIALSNMIGIYAQQYGMLMAGTLLAVLPVIILFFVLQREFVAGLTAGAVKG